VISVLAARNRELLILEKEISALSNKIIVMTDDGSHGQKAGTKQKVFLLLLKTLMK